MFISAWGLDTEIIYRPFLVLCWQERQWRKLKPNGGFRSRKLDHIICWLIVKNYLIPTFETPKTFFKTTKLRYFINIRQNRCYLVITYLNSAYIKIKSIYFSIAVLSTCWFNTWFVQGESGDTKFQHIEFFSKLWIYF